MLEETSTVSINVGVGVFYLSHFTQNAWNSLEANSGQVANVVVLNVSIGELLQVHESWVGVSEDSMSITWNNSA